jgi:predicted phosphohydrolase
LPFANYDHAMAFRIALTADLHYGKRHDEGVQATHQLVKHLKENPPDLVILAGDIGADEDFQRCLALFETVAGVKCCVPGNHDVWVNAEDRRGDSLTVYREHLPNVCADHGFHYLDHAPLVLPEAGLTVVGNMNWYDYSWGIDRIPALAEDWQDRLSRKRFPRGQHNDYHFVRWAFDDVGFTQECVVSLERQLQETDGPTIAVMHHPPFHQLNWPRAGPPTLESVMWECFSGNKAMENLLANYADRIRYAFCGHTHRKRECEHAGIRGHNIGGDYNFKRLLELDWPAGTVSALEFHGE